MHLLPSRVSCLSSTTGQEHIHRQRHHALEVHPEHAVLCACAQDTWVKTWQGVRRIKAQLSALPSIHWGYISSAILLVNLFFTPSNLNNSISFRWVVRRRVPLCHLLLHRSFTGQMNYSACTPLSECDSNRWVNSFSPMSFPLVDTQCNCQILGYFSD